MGWFSPSLVFTTIFWVTWGFVPVILWAMTSNHQLFEWMLLGRGSWSEKRQECKMVPSPASTSTALLRGKKYFFLCPSSLQSLTHILCKGSKFLLMIFLAVVRSWTNVEEHRKTTGVLHILDTKHCDSHITNSTQVSWWQKQDLTQEICNSAFKLLCYINSDNSLMLYSKRLILVSGKTCKII